MNFSPGDRFYTEFHQLQKWVTVWKVNLPLCAFGSLSSYSKAIYQKISIPVDLLCRDPGRKKFYSLTVRRHKMISPRSGPFKCSEVERANGSSSLGPR